MAVKELNSVANQKDGSPKAVNKKKKVKMKKVIPLILVLVVVLAAGTMFVSVIANSYKATLNKYFDSIEDVNGRKFSTIIHQFRKSSMEEYYDCTEDELIDEHEAVLQEKRDDLGCGDDVKIEYEISSEKRAEKEEVKEIETDLNKNLSYIGAEPVKITAALELTLHVTIDGEEDYKEIHNVNVKLIKENGKWKIYDCDI